MIVCENEQLKTLLESNSSFKLNFEKLLLAFKERTWTPEVCALFKALCEDLFKAYKININVHVKNGKFEIDFLDKVYVKKYVDRKPLDIVKWMLRK